MDVCKWPHLTNGSFFLSVSLSPSGFTVQTAAHDLIVPNHRWRSCLLSNTSPSVLSFSSVLFSLSQLPTSLSGHHVTFTEEDADTNNLSAPFKKKVHRAYFVAAPLSLSLGNALICLQVVTRGNFQSHNTAVSAADLPATEQEHLRTAVKSAYCTNQKQLFGNDDRKKKVVLLHWSLKKHLKTSLSEQAKANIVLLLLMQSCGFE